MLTVRSLKILEQEFPLVPHNAIWSVIKEKKSLYLAYQELFTQEHSFEQTQRPYARLEHTRLPSMDKEWEVIQAYEYRYGADDTIEELNAAKEATRLEASMLLLFVFSLVPFVLPSLRQMPCVKERIKNWQKDSTSKNTSNWVGS